MWNVMYHFFAMQRDAFVHKTAVVRYGIDHIQPYGWLNICVQLVNFSIDIPIVFFIFILFYMRF